VQMKREVDKIEREIKDSLEKKSHLVTCLKNFYLSVLKNEDFFNLLEFDLSEILVSLWKLKYKVDFCDMPAILDEKSRAFLLDLAEMNRQYEKMKKKTRKRKFESSKTGSMILMKNSSLHENNDKNGFYEIRSFQKSFKNFETQLEKKCRSFHEVSIDK